MATLRTSQGVVEEESACRQAVEQMLNQRGRVSASPKPSISLPEFVGPYRVLEPIAAGGMGMVLRAQHPKLKRTVAIKLLPLQQWAGSTAVARFEREMEVIGNLDHPNIVRASDAGDAGGMHYLVMDFIDGTDLSQLVHRLGPLPVADACEIARQTAIGLQYVHDAGLVHRDIKPSNIMLTGDGRVKILDLGLAMLNEQFSEDANNLTTVGQLMGTLDYMSPEQAADSRQVDARADIYSLGATLFKLLTGQAAVWWTEPSFAAQEGPGVGQWPRAVGPCDSLRRTDRVGSDRAALPGQEHRVAIHACGRSGRGPRAVCGRRRSSARSRTRRLSARIAIRPRRHPGTGCRKTLTSPPSWPPKRRSRCRNQVSRASSSPRLSAWPRWRC